MKQKQLIISSFIVISSIILSVIFYSCEKHINDSQNSSNNELTTQASSNIMKFNSIDEYRKATTKVLYMTFEELKNYENSIGFTSIGRTEDEFYDNINPESFKNSEEFMAFIANNSEYIKLVEDEYGEQELVTINENNTDRYFMNKNGMYQVGNIAYKVLNDEVKISSQVENIDKLKQLDLNNYETNISSEFKVHTSKLVTFDINNTQSTLKSTFPGCGEQGRDLETNGNNRTEVKAYYTTSNAGGGDYRDWLNARLRIKNQKKSWGVWLNAIRTTSYDLRVKYHFWNEGGGWDYFSYDKSASNNSFAKREWQTTVALTYGDNLNHIEAYDMWCDTPNIDEIHITCNVGGL